MKPDKYGKVSLKRVSTKTQNAQLWRRSVIATYMIMRGITTFNLGMKATPKAFGAATTLFYWLPGRSTPVKKKPERVRFFLDRGASSNPRPDQSARSEWD